MTRMSRINDACDRMLSFHVDVAVGERPNVHSGFGHLVVAPRGVAEHVAHGEEGQDLTIL